MSNAIICQHISKEFYITPNYSHSLKSSIAYGSFRRRKKSKFKALDDVSFSVQEGEILGLIGPNGSGKSTLLKIISRITTPTKGKVEIFGHVNTLLEVGTGFHPELTGQENIFLNGSILGLKKQEIRSRYDEIVEFAEISDFLNVPVKHYSSGMYVRLAFAVAAHLDPDILIVDEVLSVGDEAFQKKCLDKMECDIMNGRTVLFVSHNMDAVRRLCSKVILLENGSVTLEGEPGQVIKHYSDAISKIHSISLSDPSVRRGNGSFRIVNISLKTVNHQPSVTFSCGDKMHILIEYSSDLKTIPEMDIHLKVKSTSGQELFTCVSSMHLQQNLPMPGSGRMVCTIARLPLNTGKYHLDIFGFKQKQLADHISQTGDFVVVPGHFYPSGKLPSNSFKILTDYEWSLGGH